MSSKQRPARKRKPYGPNIVRAWFDTVIQYALRGIENERSFLEKRNWTFRFRTRKLEYLALLAEHLPSAGRENMEQFVAFFPGISALVDKHDRRELQLEQSCNVYFEALLKSPDFRGVFQSVVGETPQALGREFSTFFGAYSEADAMGFLAEYVVNNLEDLPIHYSTAELWNHYRKRFITVASTPEVAPLAASTSKSGSAMIEVIGDLASFLKKTRSELSLEFDVPYVAELTSAI